MIAHEINKRQWWLTNTNRHMQKGMRKRLTVISKVLVALDRSLCSEHYQKLALKIVHGARRKRTNSIAFLVQHIYIFYVNFACGSFVS